MNLVPGLGIEPRTRDFQSPALPTELSGQRGALNLFASSRQSNFFNLLQTAQSIILCRYCTHCQANQAVQAAESALPEGVLEAC